ncbi:3'-5' exonuclease [Paenibacillus shenyangensis]|uniref:3'-5' exonuclease n=1 Tax=Paenibacillus sp. A9 TaxID=1284352 RepID=UPI00037BFF8A|nr:3'-5' exonuclease [Paenibacillus sp. A9]
MNYIIFDLEATCWQEHTSRAREIIEIGAVRLDDRLQQIGEYQTFVRPVLHYQLSPFCTQLTSISQEQIEHAPYFPEALSGFRSWIGTEEYLLCSWGFYDRRQLEQDCRLHQLPSDWLQQHISIKHQHGRMIGREKGIGMQRALQMMNLPFLGTPHRAIDDARNIAGIFTHIFEHIRWE